MRRILAFIAILFFCGTAGAFAWGPFGSSSVGGSAPSSGVLLYQNGNPVIAASTSWTTLATVTIPASSMGANGKLEIETAFLEAASVPGLSYQWVWGSGAVAIGGIASNPSHYDWDKRWIWNNNSTSSQSLLPNGNSAPGGLLASGNGVTSASADTTQTQTLLFQVRGNLGSAIATTAVTADGTYCTATVASGAFPSSDGVYATGITMSGASASCANVGTSSATTTYATAISSTQFKYPCPCASGTSATTQGTVQEITSGTLLNFQVVEYPHN